MLYADGTIKVVAAGGPAGGFGAVIPPWLGNKSRAVTVAIGTNPSGGTLSGTKTVNAVAGVATFSGLSIDNIGTGYTLVASASGLTSGTSTAFDITSKGPNDTSALELPGTGIPLNQWQFGVSPFPTIPPPASTLGAGATGRIMSPTYRNPYSEQWNFGYSFQPSQGSVLEVDYVHELGVHEADRLNINPTIASLGGARGLGGHPAVARDASRLAVGRPVAHRPARPRRPDRRSNSRGLWLFLAHREDQDPVGEDASAAQEVGQPPLAIGDLVRRAQAILVNVPQDYADEIRGMQEVFPREPPQPRKGNAVRIVRESYRTAIDECLNP